MLWVLKRCRTPWWSAGGAAGHGPGRSGGDPGTSWKTAPFLPEPPTSPAGSEQTTENDLRPVIDHARRRTGAPGRRRALPHRQIDRRDQGPDRVGLWSARTRTARACLAAPLCREGFPWRPSHGCAHARRAPRQATLPGTCPATARLRAPRRRGAAVPVPLSGARPDARPRSPGWISQGLSCGGAVGRAASSIAAATGVSVKAGSCRHRGCAPQDEHPKRYLILVGAPSGAMPFVPVRRH